MSGIKSFLESYCDDYYALPPEERVAVNVITVLNVVGSVAVIGWMVHDRRRRKMEKESRRAYDDRRAAYYEQNMAFLRELNERLLRKERERLAKIEEEARNTSPETAEDLQKKLDDPNYIWEL